MNKFILPLFPNWRSHIIDTRLRVNCDNPQLGDWPMPGLCRLCAAANACTDISQLLQLSAIELVKYQPEKCKTSPEILLS